MRDTQQRDKRILNLPYQKTPGQPPHPVKSTYEVRIVIERYLRKLHSGAFCPPSSVLSASIVLGVSISCKSAFVQLLLLHSAVSLGTARRALGQRCRLPLTDVSDSNTIALYAMGPPRFLAAEPDGRSTALTCILCLPALSVSS